MLPFCFLFWLHLEAPHISLPATEDLQLIKNLIVHYVHSISAFHHWSFTLKLSTQSVIAL